MLEQILAGIIGGVIGYLAWQIVFYLLKKGMKQ